MSRSTDGTPHIDKSARPGIKEGAVAGGILGGLLGALVLAPLTAGATATVAAAAVGGGAATMSVVGALAGGTRVREWKEAAGITDDFVRQVGAMVQQGQSALFALATLSDAPAVMKRFRGTGGTILHTTLAGNATVELEKILTRR